MADGALRPVAVGYCLDPRHLMVHWAQEMNHLARFLPALYEGFGDE